MADTDSQLVELTTGIVTAYVERNQVRPEDLPGLIQSVHAALKNAGSEEPAIEPVDQPSAAEIRKSMRGDSLISFLDGKPYKSLKRHLSTNGMTPDEYRQRFGLPASYPMVSPDYSARRSALAKALGLGSKGRGKAPTNKGRAR